ASAAAITPSPSALTLSQAVAFALTQSPELQRSQYLLRAADARITQAGIAPSPELSLQLENIGGSGRYKNTNALETTFLLSQVIELGDKRAMRSKAAAANRQLVSVENDARQLDILAEVTRRYIQVAVNQEEQILALQATTLAEQTLREVKKRVNAAKSPLVELNRAHIALTKATIKEEHAEHELLTARRKLSAMWGELEPTFTTVTANLFELPEPARFSTLLARLKANPDFTRFASEQRLRDAELRVAEARRVPNIQIGGGVRQLNESDDHALVLSLSVPLFAGSRNAGYIAEAAALRERVVFDERAAFIRAQADLFAIYQELQHALTEARILKREVVPQIAAILQQTEYAYQRGRYSYLDWIAAQGEMLSTQSRLIEASANAHRYFVDIERLTGESLLPDAGESTSTRDTTDAQPQRSTK
ncbi:MAG: TolC family protein, partial [Paraperlucidibaca sp.]